jgi:tetratricopeptide (TPR) repeat protein
LHYVGDIHHRAGDLDQAVLCYQRAADLRRRSHHRLGEAATLISLGEVELEVRYRAAARQTYDAAALILDELGHPQSGPLRQHDRQVRRVGRIDRRPRPSRPSRQ